MLIVGIGTEINTGNINRIVEEEGKVETTSQTIAADSVYLKCNAVLNVPTHGRGALNISTISASLADNYQFVGSSAQDIF